MSLSSAQANALRAVRTENDSTGKGVTPPVGPASRPYNTLRDRGLLVRNPGSSLHFITNEGRAVLERCDRGPTPAPGVKP